MNCGEIDTFQKLEAQKFDGILRRVNLLRKRSPEKFTCTDCAKGDPESNPPLIFCHHNSGFVDSSHTCSIGDIATGETMALYVYLMHNKDFDKLLLDDRRFVRYAYGDDMERFILREQPIIKKIMYGWINIW